jgi:DNA-binding HxlR family transcriptional regulator
MLAAMRASELADLNCSVARPAAVLGDRWTLMILRQAFNGIKRFEDFQQTLGISRSLLSERLARLVEAGVLRREPYKDEVRTRDRYRLTEMGLDLYPVLMALREWGDRYLAEDGPPVRVRHADCGGEPKLELRCSKCGEEVGARDAEALPGAEAVPSPDVRVA